MNRDEARAQIARAGAVMGVLRACFPECPFSRLGDVAWTVVHRETAGGRVLAVGEVYGSPALLLPGGRVELHLPGVVGVRPLGHCEGFTLRAVLA